MLDQRRGRPRQRQWDRSRCPLVYVYRRWRLANECHGDNANRLIERECRLSPNQRQRTSRHHARTSTDRSGCLPSEGQLPVGDPYDLGQRRRVALERQHASRRQTVPAHRRRRACDGQRASCDRGGIDEGRSLTC
jgi:hypothetical protein